MLYWQGGGHELDCVVDENTFIEVTRGPATALDFAWFSRVFRRGHLTVVCATLFEADRARGVTLELFLAGPP
jgi:hypothetical protein